jgi:hypothetical protein
MKIRKKARFNTTLRIWDSRYLTQTWKSLWKKYGRVLRITSAESTMAERLGISMEDYARSRLQRRAV